MEILRKCPYCREDIQHNAIKCKHCGEYLSPADMDVQVSRVEGEYATHPPQPVVPPDNYLVWAILVTIFCCLPFGIVSIVYSSKVDTAFAMGNYNEARRLSAKALTWIHASWITGLSVMLIYLGVIFLAGGLAVFADPYQYL